MMTHSAAQFLPALRPARVTTSLVMIALLFVIAGIMHFVIPGQYARIMPKWLPAPMALVLISGAFEIAGGMGVLVPSTRVVAGWGLIALLVAVFPANVQMLTTALASHASRGYVALLVARLPLQPLLMYWVYRTAIAGA